jgi:hypothetical protein
MSPSTRFFLSPLLICLFLAAPLIAVPPFVVEKAEPGKYLLTVEADGSVSLVPIRSVSPGGTTPNPNPTPNPTPGQPTEFSKAIQALTKSSLNSGGSPTTAAALSSVYSLVAEGIADQSIPEANAFLAVKLGTDTVLNNVADKDKWAKWRTDVGLALETLRQQGVLKLPGAFNEISDGIDSAIGGSINPKYLVGLTAAQQGALVNADKLFENIDLAKLIELIKLIIELFKAFRPM